jgi:hypothetical protein
MVNHARGDEEDGGSDWLNDSGDEQQADQKEDDGSIPSMAARDSAKVEQRMYDVSGAWYSKRSRRLI